MRVRETTFLFKSFDASEGAFDIYAWLASMFSAAQGGVVEPKVLLRFMVRRKTFLPFLGRARL